MKKVLAAVISIAAVGMVLIITVRMSGTSKIAAPAPTPPSPAEPQVEGYPFDVRRVQKEYITRAWPALKQRLIDEINAAENVTGEGTLIYNVQIYTNVLLDYAAETGNAAILQDLDEIYSLLLPRLSRKKTYKFWDGYDAHWGYKYVEVPTQTEIIGWFDEEGLEWEMSSAQFLYAVLRLMHARKDDGAFAAKYAPIVKNFYTRMIFGIEPGTSRGNFTRVGWLCFAEPSYEGIERFNHLTHVAYLRAKRYIGESSTCNALDDTDNWLIIGTIEMLALDAQKPSAFGFTEEERQKLRQYARDGADLIRSHFAPDTVTFKATGERFPSLHFEPGLWRDHPDNAYTGYTGAQFPEELETSAIPSVPPESSWDLSHAIRLLQITDTLHRNAPLTGVSFTEDDVRNVASQIGLATFHGTLEKPAFTNMISGDNGWFRVNYSGRAGFGYHPSAMSITFPTGGLCRFRRYQPEIQKICNGLYRLTRTKDPELLRHRRDVYELCITWEYERYDCGAFDFERDDFGILTFYASL